MPHILKVWEVELGAKERGLLTRFTTALGRGGMYMLMNGIICQQVPVKC